MTRITDIYLGQLIIKRKCHIKLKRNFLNVNSVFL